MKEGRPGLTTWSVRVASEGLDEKNIKDHALESGRDNSFAGGRQCARAGHLRANDRARARVRI